MVSPIDLAAVPDSVWQSLAARAGPWRTPVLASVEPGRGGDARVVVLRAAARTERRLLFFTDRRSRKYAQLHAAPGVCLCVFDADADWQVRLYGDVAPVADGRLLDGWWYGLAEHQRRLYSNDAAVPAGASKEKGRGNFAAFQVTVERFHCLWLRADGNVAAEFVWRDGEWSGRFVRP